MKQVVAVVAGALVAVLLVTLAVMHGGFDAKQVAHSPGDVWVWRENGSVGQYARVNTKTGELDAVRSVAAPSAVVQLRGQAMVLTSGNTRAWQVDPANPRDIKANQNEADANIPLPEDTVAMAAAAQWLVFITSGGQAYVADFRQGDDVRKNIESALLVAQNSGNPANFVAAAVAESGEVMLYDKANNAVVRYNAVHKSYAKTVHLPQRAASAAGYEVTFAGNSWAVLSENKNIWVPNATDPLEVPGGAARLAPASAAAANITVVSNSGLYQVAGGQLSELAQVSGAPAKPEIVSGVVYAAWAAGNSVRLWRSDEPDSTQNLTVQQSEIEPARLVISSNGDTAVLTDTAAGRIWQLPDGIALPLTQWQQTDQPDVDTGENVLEDSPDSKPPVATADSFGARADSTVELPVLLNDFDPNRQDVLTIDTADTAAVTSEFGELKISSDRQRLILQTKPGATGTASFSYRVTDGVLNSEQVGVTVTIQPDSVQNPPVWCGVNNCRAEFVSPSIAPGGMSVYDVLNGWVDPEGDPITLAAVQQAQPQDPLKTVIAADGRVAVQHTDAQQPGSFAAVVAVNDSRGAVGSHEMTVTAQPGAPLRFAAQAVSATVGERVKIDPLKYVVGGSGSYRLESVTSAATGVLISNDYAAGSSLVTAQSELVTPLSVSVIDTVTGQQIESAVWLYAAAQKSALSLQPMRAYVRKNSDITVDLADAVSGSASRVFALTSAVPAAEPGAQLYTDTIEHSKLRIAGTASNFDSVRYRNGDEDRNGQGAAKAIASIGKITATVTDGTNTATGVVSVYEVPENTASQIIARPDEAIVRAGNIVDIKVLENDVSPWGENLVLNPEVGATTAEGSDLAFVSGDTLRYLAPKEPGVYNLEYTVSAANHPEVVETAVVKVTVLEAAGNRDPLPQNTTVRLAAGSNVTAMIPVSGVDPDGDRVRITDVTAEHEGITAFVTARGIRVATSSTVEPGVYNLGYTVRDAFGGSGTANLQVFVVAEAATAPIVYNDYVRVAEGVENAVALYPLDNDSDPSGGVLELVSIEPQLPGGDSHPEYKKMRALLDTSELEAGKVTVKTLAHAATTVYRYEVRSRLTGSSSEGLLTVQTTGRVQPQPATVYDTVLSVSERTQLERAGINVVAGKVRWLSGNTAGLELSLVGDNAAKYSVEGHFIRGSYNPAGDQVVFKLAGKDSAGQDVVSYGFMFVPPLDDLRLTLRNSFEGLSAAENETVTQALEDIIETSPGDTLQFVDRVSRTLRAGSRCEIKNGQVMYTAGSGAPWHDVCVIEARVAGQTTYTKLAIKINVVPKQPVPELREMHVTAQPGSVKTINLTDMVRWLGGSVGDSSALQFRVGADTQSVRTSLQGHILQLDIAADAVSGSKVALPVSAGQLQAPLVVKIGQVSELAPRGGIVQMRCITNAECAALAIGVPGEFDPFAGSRGAGLKLQRVESGNCATAGNFRQLANRIIFEPKDKTAGLRCSAGFIVSDAQNRLGSGAIELDLKGVPKPPVTVVQTAYTANSAVFNVTINNEQSYPPVSEVKLYSESAGQVTCAQRNALVYECRVTGLVTGQEHSFAAIAVNEVGESARSAQVVGWAFEQPQTPQVKITQTSATSEFGDLELQLLGGSADIVGYDVSVDRGRAQRHGGATNKILLQLREGEHEVRLHPVSKFAPPPVFGQQESEPIIKIVRVSTAPHLVQVQQLDRDESENTVRVKITARGGVDESTFYGVSTSGVCVPSEPSAELTVPGDAGSSISVVGCVKNKWGIAQSDPQQFIVGKVPTPTGLSYQISPLTADDNSGRRFSARVIAEPQPTGEGKVSYIINGVEHSSFKLEADTRKPQITAIREFAGRKSEAVAVAARGENVGAAPVSIVIDSDVQQVATPEELADHITELKTGGATVSYGKNDDGFVTISVAGFTEPIVTSVKTG
ncbi:hypothetical protein KJY78_05740 [Canibacter sp. lx-45]|uniref:Ig-like domain-containing protein n=1 Tax=Canibacter zhuwentaonis TaxID=2837491 RepID=UPI001BDDA613|nr:hypothetical protein [Canibacter zhuwentaonis]